MARPPKPASRTGFRIAIVSVLKVESDAVEAIFDEIWEGNGSYGKTTGDTNSYTTGRVGSHNVVLAFPSSIGKSASASAAASLRSSFPAIQLCLLVGVCGGAPEGNGNAEILLGDVIISTGVIQFDFGRQYPDKMEKKDTPGDTLARPNPEIRSFLRKLEGKTSLTLLKSKTSVYATNLMRASFHAAEYPGIEEDVLCPPTYRHRHRDASCVICSRCRSEEDEVCENAYGLTCHELGCDRAE